jgi:hypothetical protein
MCGGASAPASALPPVASLYWLNDSLTRLAVCLMFSALGAGPAIGGYAAVGIAAGISG